MLDDLAYKPETAAIVENLPFSVVYMDLDFNIIYGNQNFWNTVEVNKEDLIGRPCYETVGEYAERTDKVGREKICHYCMVGEARRSGKTIALERPFRDKFLKVTTVPEKDADGNVLRFMEVIEDVTELRQAEITLRSAHEDLENKVRERTRELQAANSDLEREVTERRTAEDKVREINARLENLINAIPDQVFFKDANGRYLMVNKSCAESLGLTEDFFLGRSDEDISPPDVALACRRSDEEAIGKGSPSRCEESYLDLMGEKRFLDVIKFPIFNDKGDLEGLGGISRDVTEQREAAEALQRSVLEKETLLRELYHRTKNNMQVIASLIKLQTRAIKDGEALRILQDTNHRIHSMALVHEMLYGARDLSMLNLGDYITGLTEGLMQSLAGDKKGISLRSEVEKVPVSIDTVIPLGLVINEIMTNALKYAFPDGREGTITITGRMAEDKFIEMDISDDGTGMPGLVDPRKPRSLGLTIIRTLIENQLKGTVDIQSSVEGTSFRFRFRNKEDKAGSEG